MRLGPASISGSTPVAASATAAVAGVPFASATNSLSGAIGGGQVGYNWQTGIALAPGWSAKLEYLYLNFGKVSTTWLLAGLPPITDSDRFDMNVVRAGVNYRF